MCLLMLKTKEAEYIYTENEDSFWHNWATIFFYLVAKLRICDIVGQRKLDLHNTSKFVQRIN
ncbi:hypothetical protein Zm00014a_042999 [Zea mays]|uniref:Uncharacterized protein n=1 Tax=Zea mays TaxID=4577 RepID=A0A3L6EWG0_MAIZE|nr:hypothetical protein Zm00014a_042999 [Zea mays]